MNETDNSGSLDDIFNTPKESRGKNVTILLMDSDTFCYRAASATDGRTYVVHGHHAFKYKADAVTYCNKKEIPLEEIECEFYPEPFEHAVKILNISIRGVRNYARSNYSKYDMEFFHTGKENFRHGILAGYKANRSDRRKPEHLDGLKANVRGRFHTVEKAGLEADDLIAMRAYQLSKEDRPFVIVSNDKDMKTIPGDGYNWVKKQAYKMNSIEAMKFFYGQTLAGDDADNIPGVPGVGMNDKGTGRANKIIQKAHEEFDKDSYHHDDYLYQFECHLYRTCLEHWILGGPGKKGSYGCKPIKEVMFDFERSAKCLFMMRMKGVTWQTPQPSWSNYGY